MVTDLITQFDSEWTLGGWSIGGNGCFTAYVHGHGACSHANGATARKAFDFAVTKFRERYPDELTVKRNQLAEAQATAARLERELSEAA